MEKLAKIIVQKYFPGFENFQPRDRLTDDEYQIVKRCTLDDLLETESNPAGLEQICEGEKVQTAEYYKHKRKNFERNLARFHRKPPQTSRQRRVVTRVVPSTHVNHTAANGDRSAAHDDQPVTHLVVAEELQEPTRSNEANNPQHDPYQLPEGFAPLPTIQPSAMLPEDDNFGSKDVDGARDFLQLCTGEELPPMSLRESMTREMLMAQFPSIPKPAPMVDNFQELDLRAINTPLFKRPLQASTPLVAIAEPVAQQPLPELEDLMPVQEVLDVQPHTTVEAVPTSAPAISMGERSDQRNVEMTQILASGSSSSTNHSEIVAPQPRRIGRGVAFTGRLEPFPATVPMPRKRRNFDIFCFRCPATLNKTTIREVQTQLAERWKQQQLCEVPTAREVLTEQRMDSGCTHQLQEVPMLRDALTDHRIDSGFQQTVNEISRNVPQGNVTESSNLLANLQMEAEALSKQDPTLPSDLITTMQPIVLDQPGSIDGQLVEISDHVHLNLPSTETPSLSCEKTTAEKRPPVVSHVPILQEPAIHTAIEPVVVTELQQQKKASRKRHDKKTVQDNVDPVADISSVLFYQAKELDPIPEDDESAVEMDPVDATIVDILNVVQGEMSNMKNDSVSIERLQQLLRVHSALAAAKMFKNLITLKMADLLDIDTNSELRIANVSVKLPQVDELDIP